MTGSVAHNVLMTALVLSLVAPAAYGSGDKNMNNNPGGDSPEALYQSPSVGVENERTMIFCGEDELLVVTPINGAAAEAFCMPAEG